MTPSSLSLFCLSKLGSDPEFSDRRAFQRYLRVFESDPISGLFSQDALLGLH